MDVKDDFRLDSWTEKENIGSDTSIMIKLAFGYPFIGYGDKYELLNNGALACFLSVCDNFCDDIHDHECILDCFRVVRWQIVQ